MRESPGVSMVAGEQDQKDAPTKDHEKTEYLPHGEIPRGKEQVRRIVHGGKPDHESQV